MNWQKVENWIKYYEAPNGWIYFIPRKNLKMASKRNIRTCKNGHQFYKSTDCSTCPICEENKKPTDGFLSLLYAPARRALENANIKSLKQLSKFSENDILKLHGMGKTTIPILKKELARVGLAFNDGWKSTADNSGFATSGDYFNLWILNPTPTMAKSRNVSGYFVRQRKLQKRQWK